jgi:acetolactate synthase I/II/III large subunit
MKITVSEYIAKFLSAHGVKVVFELSGGMIMHLIDALEQDANIRLHNVYHEQSAGFAADTVGRISRTPGIALGTSGPGALNLLTGIGSSYFDSSPTLFITGQVNRHEQKGKRIIRQLGFQETDIVSIVKPITKWAERLEKAEDIKSVLPYAFSLAMCGRPGPCLIDIPMDIFREIIDADPSQSFEEIDQEDFDAKLSLGIGSLLEGLCKSKRPLILAGNGIHASGRKEIFRQIIERLNIPVVNSLLACDLLPYQHPLRVGLIGTYGNRWANHALAESDLLLVLGSRLDIRQTGADTASFSERKMIYHVDIELGEINNRIQGCSEIHASLQSFFSVLKRQLKNRAICNSYEWLDKISSMRSKWPDVKELDGIEGINPNIIMHCLSHRQSVFAYAVDVGLNQMWAAQSLELDGKARFVTSGGMGAMGFALPAGIAAALDFS